MKSAAKNSANKTLGKHGEEVAVAYLEGLKYFVTDRNYRCKCGEIDIVAKDGSTIVFVEVKTRRNASFGPPELSVTHFKQRQISKTALVYLAAKRADDANARFDVIAISMRDDEKPHIHHIRNAFDLNY